MRKYVFSIVLCCLLSSASVADVRLPAIFGDNMVLQRQMPVPVWGFADAGEEGLVGGRSPLRAHAELRRGGLSSQRPRSRP